MGECGSDGKDMDGNEDVSEDVIESHLSCLDESGSDAGPDRTSCSGGVVFVADAPGRTVCMREPAKQSARAASRIVGHGVYE